MDYLHPYVGETTAYGTLKRQMPVSINQWAKDLTSLSTSKYVAQRWQLDMGTKFDIWSDFI